MFWYPILAIFYSFMLFSKMRKPLKMLSCVVFKYIFLSGPPSHSLSIHSNPLTYGDQRTICIETFSHHSCRNDLRIRYFVCVQCTLHCKYTLAILPTLCHRRKKHTNMDLNHEFPIQFIVMFLPHTDIHMPLRVMVIHFPLVLKFESRFSVHITQFNNTLSPIIGSIRVIFFLNAWNILPFDAGSFFKVWKMLATSFGNWILVARQVCSIITLCTG